MSIVAISIVSEDEDFSGGCVRPDQVPQLLLRGAKLAVRATVLLLLVTLILRIGSLFSWVGEPLTKDAKSVSLRGLSILVEKLVRELFLSVWVSRIG